MTRHNASEKGEKKRMYIYVFVSAYVGVFFVLVFIVFLLFSWWLLLLVL